MAISYQTPTGAAAPRPPHPALAAGTVTLGGAGGTCYTLHNLPGVAGAVASRCGTVMVRHAAGQVAVVGLTPARRCVAAGAYALRLGGRPARARFGGL